MPCISTSANELALEISAKCSSIKSLRFHDRLVAVRLIPNLSSQGS